MTSFLKLFDCDAAYGRGSSAGLRDLETPADLLAEMEHCGIDEALVWHRDMWERDFASGNRRLDEIAPYPRLHPTVCFVPTCCDEMPSDEEFIQYLRAKEIRAVRAFPNKHNFLIDPISCGALLELFAAHSIPLLISLREIGWPGLYQLKRDFPDLPVIVTRVGDWGQDRLFRPLMMKYSNFYVTTHRCETAGQLKSIVDRLGSSQLIFGTGTPDYCAGVYVLMLTRAELSEEDRAAIAHGNLDRMLTEVPW